MDSAILPDVRQRDLDALARHQRAIERGNQAMTARDDLIRRLRAEGETLEAIAAVTGLTPMRVSQISRNSR